MSKRVGVRWLLVLLVGSCAVAIHGCLKVDDEITGLDGPWKGVNQCIRFCRDHAAAERASERELHVENVQNCAGDRQCISDENARYTARLREIAEDERLCKANCHNQGGGQAGE